MVLTRRIRYIEAFSFWLRWLGLGGMVERGKKGRSNEFGRL